MAQCLSEQFMESKGAPILFNGMLVHGIYVKTVQAGSTFNVKFVSYTTDFVQGLTVKTDRQVLEVANQRLKSFVLWADTPTRDVECRVRGRGIKTIKFWNSWRDGGTMAWMRNAGMRIEEIDGGVRLHCSDGRGDADFTDLVVEITFS